MTKSFLSSLFAVGALATSFSLTSLTAIVTNNIAATAINNLNLPDSITLTGTVRDFKAEYPDMAVVNNSGQFISEVILNTVSSDLGVDGKPVFHYPNDRVTTSENFDRWFKNIPCQNSGDVNCNQSKIQSITLTRDSQTGNYVYENNNFFPINGELFDDPQNSPSNSLQNSHFTYELNNKFTYHQGQVFRFASSSDMWVFINGRRVVDLGGIRDNASVSDASNSSTVTLDDLGLTEGQTYDMVIFYAARKTGKSALRIETWISESNASISQNAGDTTAATPQVFWD